MRKLIYLFTFLALAPLSDGATTPTPDPKIASVNAKVAEIHKATAADAYLTLLVEEKGWSEGAPPSIKFFSHKSTGKLAAAMFGVGHETWASHYWYYYDEAENILKYTQESVGLPANANVPKTAAIYAGGKRLWSNLSGPPPLAPVEVVALFRTLQSARGKISAIR